jgi:hypothetical protein
MRRYAKEGHLSGACGRNRQRYKNKTLKYVITTGTTGYYGTKIRYFSYICKYFYQKIFCVKYEEYEIALSTPRIRKYRVACNNDKTKALILYRYNIKLCQKFYGVLGVFEVILRNAINEHYKTYLSDSDWLITQAQNGFLVNYQDSIFKEKDKLVNNKKYTHDKLVASLSLGVWTFLFSRNCYKSSGKTLLQIFPKKAHGLNQKDIYSDLDKIRIFRNRIAHHEPLCFDSAGAINVHYVKEIYALIIKYIDFLGYTTNELLYGVEVPSSTITKIQQLTNTIIV